MRKIGLVIKEDFKNIFENGTTFIIILTLVLVPALFSWFIIRANGLATNTSTGIKVAIVNEDIGVSISNQYVNVGKSIAEILTRNKQLNWQMVSYEEGNGGFLVGEYYGMVVIPQKFSEELVELKADQLVLPQISYKINARENVVTPAFVETSSTKLQVSVAQDIVYAINEATSQAIGELDVDLTIDTTEIKKVIETLLDLDANREEYANKIKTYRDISGNTMVLLANLNDELPELKRSVEAVSRLGGSVEQVLRLFTELKEEYANIVDKDATIPSIKLNTEAHEVKKLITYIEQEIPQLQTMLQESGQSVRKVYSVLNRADSVIGNMTRDLHGLEHKLSFLANDNTLNKLVYMLANDPELVRQSITGPVILKKEDIKELPNYGSVLAPFNMAVVMWMGGTILVATLSTRVQSEKEELKEVHPLEEYFGKAPLFIVLNCIQTVIMIVGARRFMDIYIERFWIFLGIGVIGSIAFTSIIYTLTSVLGNMGKAIAYIISVLQLFSLSGAFPEEVVPFAFRRINRILPFSYIVKGLREVQIGIVTNNLMRGLMIILIFIVSTVICGIIGKTILASVIQNIRLNLRASNLGKQDY